MNCPKHPDLPAQFICEKFEVHMCEQCVKCRSPKTHCKFRPHCVIWRLIEEELTEESTEESVKEN